MMLTKRLTIIVMLSCAFSLAQSLAVNVDTQAYRERQTFSPALKANSLILLKHH